MLKNMTTVLFIIRKSKAKTQNYYLYCRITINGIDQEFSTEERILYPESWNQSTQIYNKEGEEGEYINTLTSKLRYRIKEIALNEPDQSLVTPDQIINKLKAPAKKVYTVVELVQKYIDHERDQGDLCEDTISHHDTYLNTFKIYLMGKPMYPQNFTVREAERFKTYLRDFRNCKHKTRRSRYIEFFSKSLTWAINEELIEEHKLVFYKGQRDPQKENVFLERQEREAWATVVLSSKSLIDCRNLGTYQMCTGVEYGNIWGKFRVTIIPGVGKIIEGQRNKNGAWFALPYSQMAEDIINYYSGELPYYDNSTYNKNIKIIGNDILKINKRFTSHMFRRTFSMKMKADGWSVEARKTMLGHKTIKTTEQSYDGYSPEVIINEMAKQKLTNAKNENIESLPIHTPDRGSMPFNPRLVP